MGNRWNMLGQSIKLDLKLAKRFTWNHTWKYWYPISTVVKTTYFDQCYIMWLWSIYIYICAQRQRNPGATQSWCLLSPACCWGWTLVEPQPWILRTSGLLTWLAKLALLNSFPMQWYRVFKFELYLKNHIIYLQELFGMHGVHLESGAIWECVEFTRGLV